MTAAPGDSGETMTADTPGTAVRRLLPVWGVIVTTAIASLFLIRESGSRFLERGFHTVEDTCQVAEIKYLGAMRNFRELSAEIAANPARSDTTNLRAADSLGELSGDPRIDAPRADLLEAVRLCPDNLPGAHEALAALEWWDGNEAASHYHVGQEHLVQKEAEFAVVEFEIAYALDGTNAAYALALAGALADNDRAAEAAAVVDGAPEEARDTAIAWRVAGQLAREQGRHDESFEALKKSLEREPGNFQAAWRFLASGHNSNREREASLWLYENMEDAVAPTAWVYHSIAIRLQQFGDLEIALRSIEKARVIAPFSIELMVENARILHSLGRDGEAVRMIELAISSNHALFMQVLEDTRFADVRDFAQPHLGPGNSPPTERED